MSKLVVLGDVVSAGVAGVWASSYGMGKVGEFAVKSFAISVLARVISENSGAIAMINSNQKDRLVVAVLGMISSYMQKGNLVKGALSQVAVDLLGDEITRLINQDPGYSFYTFPAGGGNTGNSTA